CSVFCHENQSPNAPWNNSSQACSGLLPPAKMKAPNSSSAPVIASSGSATASIASALRSESFMSGRLADDAFHEVVHALELDVGLLEGLAGGDDDLAAVVLQPGAAALEDVEAAFHHRGADVVGVLACGRGHHRAIGGRLDEAVLQAAAHEVRMRLAAACGIDDGL